MSDLHKVDTVKNLTTRMIGSFEDLIKHDPTNIYRGIPYVYLPQDKLINLYHLTADPELNNFLVRVGESFYPNLIYPRNEYKPVEDLDEVGTILTEGNRYLIPQNIWSAINEDSEWEGKVEKIGKGGFSILVRGYDKWTGNSVAIKSLKIKAFDNEDTVPFELITDFIEEARMLVDLENSPSFPKLKTIGWIPNEESSKNKDNFIAFLPILIMEEVKGRSLSDLIKDPNVDLSIGVKLEILQQIAEAFQYLIDRGIFLLDLKLQNIIVDFQGRRPIVKITDFGGAYGQIRSYRESRPYNTQLSEKYVAPEIIYHPRHHGLDAQLIVHAFGVLAYYLFKDDFSNYAFQTSDETPTPHKHNDEHLIRSSQINEPLYRVLEKATDFYPSNRHSTILDCINDIRKAIEIE